MLCFFVFVRFVFLYFCFFTDNFYFLPHKIHAQRRSFVGILTDLADLADKK